MSIGRNTLYNLGGALAPLVVTLLTLPLYVSLIGEERFGVLSIAWIFLGYFGLFDLGLSQATAQRVAKLRDAAPIERTETFWTALTLNAGFGALGGALLWPVMSVFFSRYFQVDSEIRTEIIDSIPWLIVAIPIATISGVFSGSLQGRERFLELNIINLTGTVLFQVVPLCAAAMFGPTLAVLLPSVILARLITFILLFIQIKRHLPIQGKPSFKKKLIGPLFRFGGWVTVSAVISPIMTTLDRLLIGSLLGAKSVTHYTVPFNLASRVTIIPASLTSALFPRLSAVDSKASDRLAIDAVQALVVVVTPLIIAGIFFMEPFLAFWISGDFASSAAPAGRVILLGLWANCYARVPYIQLQARGRPDLVAKSHVIELAPYLLLLYIGLVNFGLIGAAIAWSLRVTVDAILLFFLSGTHVRAFKIFFLPGLFLIVASTVAMFSGGDVFLIYFIKLALFVSTIIWSIRSSPPSISSRINRLFFLMIKRKSV